MLRGLEIPDEERLAGRMARQLADRLPPGCVISPWRRGADYAALLVEADGERRFVLRVPLREVTPTAYDGTVDFGAVLEREVLAHGVLARAGVPVAGLRGWRRARGEGERSWMLLDLVPDDGAAELGETRLRRLGEVLARVHTADVPASRRAGLGADCAPEAMARRIEIRVGALAARVPLDGHRALVEAATTVAGERAGRAPLRLLHMDLRRENLCFHGDDLVAVLDLSNCTMGDPAAELGRMRAYGLLEGPLLAGYGQAGGEPADERTITAYAADTFALLGLLGTDEFADQALVDRAVTGLGWCAEVLRG
ncbi:phosphotransferase family protein [Streptosporangium jomthongense]|uniref:Phosphotransferase family protein n=1 Tax=Streptosporangium jomthongense TaxID=1193683 RepID=A0ABV8F4V5_9ACTN